MTRADRISAVKASAPTAFLGRTPGTATSTPRTKIRAEAWPPIDGLDEILGLDAESIVDEVADELAPGDDDEFWDDDAQTFESDEEQPSWAKPLASFYDDLEAEARGATPNGNLGDFSTRDEAERFREMPPIGRAELDDINWDEFSARIAEFE